VELIGLVIGLLVFSLIVAIMIWAILKVSGTSGPLLDYSSSLIVFTRQLSRMLSMNLPLIEALHHLREEIGGELCGGKQRLMEAIPLVIRDLEEGLTLSQSVARHNWAFPPIYAGLVAVGERNEKLPAVLEETALFMERRRVTMEGLFEIIIYPAIIVIGMIGIVQFLVRYILPTFVSLFEGMSMNIPLLTKLMIIFARSMISTGGYLTILILFLAVILITWSFGRMKGYSLFDYLAFRLPCIGRYAAMREYASFSGLMGALLGASVPLKEALYMASSAMDNTYVAHQIRHVADESPSILSAALRATKVFQPSYLWMTLAGERTETLDEVLSDMGKFYSDESRIFIKRFMGWLQPLLLITLGTVTVICTTSVFLPLVQIVVAISRDIVH